MHAGYGKQLERRLGVIVSRGKSLWPQAADRQLGGLAWIRRLHTATDRHPVAEPQSLQPGAPRERAVLFPVFDPAVQAPSPTSTEATLCRGFRPPNDGVVRRAAAVRALPRRAGSAETAGRGGLRAFARSGRRYPARRRSAQRTPSPAVRRHLPERSTPYGFDECEIIVECHRLDPGVFQGRFQPAGKSFHHDGFRQRVGTDA